MDWQEIALDALCASDNGNNPFYRDDDDTVRLAAEIGEAFRMTVDRRLAEAMHATPGLVTSGFGFTPDEHLAKCRELAPRLLANLVR